MSDSVLDGLTLEVARAGATGAGGSGCVLEGLTLEVARRLDPGEAQITQFRASILANDFPGPMRVTHIDGPSVSSTEPAATRVTHEYLSVSSTEPSAARVTHLYVQVSQVAGPPIIQLRGCDLLLEVFEDDRETVKWQATTHPSSPNPYLLQPDRYAEQELDVAKGSATIATITVVVADKAQTPGDQDSGFMTAKLAENALADLSGRRARLLRAVPDPDAEFPGEVLLEVLIDGVAGTPRMDQSYAAFGFEIRDIRETERKIRCFDGSVEGTNSLVPHGPLVPYGFNPEDATYLLPQVGPLTGTFSQNATNFPNPATGSVDLTGNPVDERTIPIKIHGLLFGQPAEQGPLFLGLTPIWERVRFAKLAVWWRPAGSGDPWHVIDPTHLVMDIRANYPRYNMAVVTTDLGGDLVSIDRIAFGDDRVATAGLGFGGYGGVPYDPPDPEAQLPADGQSIELLIVTAGPASPDNPFHIEGLTAGEFTKNVYDGVYSARDADGNLVPSGIRYDQDAVLAMTDLIRLRLTEPITDARDWLEKYIYTPLGYVPALDIFGRISPVSQAMPDDLTDLPVVRNANSEPSPEWHAGERKINILRFKYPRDYLPQDSDDAETGDGLSDREVLEEYVDPFSVLRHGEQVLEIDGRAFRAIGTPITAEPVLTGGIAAELGSQLAKLRWLHVGNRYSLGAPVIGINVLRSAMPDLRAGSWVGVDLTWMPDYVTRRRGLIAYAQAVAVGDLDCVWRHLVLEVVNPLGGS